MSYLYGPVPSRRLGLSLGVDIVPLKTCTLSCIYCQVGRTPETTLERREYVPVQAVLDEIRVRLESGLRTDWITFSGSGEPTLHSGIDAIIQGIRALTDTPICVITNGTLLWDSRVRSDIHDADAVMPSLDSAIEETFRVVCRPHSDLHVANIIEGLVRFREEYEGKLWLEILLVDGLNDSPEELLALKKAVERIAPDSVQLNTVVRPPAELSAKPLSPERMREIRDFFGERAEIIASFGGESRFQTTAGIEAIRDYLKRRPGSTDDIVKSLGIAWADAEALLKKLHTAGEIKQSEFSEGRFWEYLKREND